MSDIISMLSTMERRSIPLPGSHAAGPDLFEVRSGDIHADETVSRTKSVALLSDNCAPMCDEVLIEVLRANHDFAPSYGGDAYTARATKLLREIFEADCDVFFVSTGVAANGISLASVCMPYNSVICSNNSHIIKDECGAIPFFAGGTQLLPTEEVDGKLSAKNIEYLCTFRRDAHFQSPAALSLSQATEYGTTYRVEELEDIVSVAKWHGLAVHVDGARLANAVASSHPASLAALSKLGIDVISFGGVKNGGLLGEAIVVLNKVFVRSMGQRIKQSGHLVPKTRYIAASWIGLLQDDTWLRNARNANRMANLLANHIKPLPNIHVEYPVQANSVFIRAEEALISCIRSELNYETYAFISPGLLRLTCGWNTSVDTIEAICEELCSVSGRSKH